MENRHDLCASPVEIHRRMRTPRRAASLLGLARAAQKTGHRAESAEAAKDFLAAWHLADTDRPELAEARALAR